MRDTKITLLIELERMFGIVTGLYRASEESAQLEYVLAIEQDLKERINSGPVTLQYHDRSRTARKVSAVPPPAKQKKRSSVRRKPLTQIQLPDLFDPDQIVGMAAANDPALGHYVGEAGDADVFADVLAANEDANSLPL